MVNALVTNNESKGGYFPLEYHLGFLDYLSKRNDIEVITYDDLAWGEASTTGNWCANWLARWKVGASLIPRASEWHEYKREYANWKHKLRIGKRDPRKIYVLIQHDVDSHPERTFPLLREEANRGIPSNVMIFAQRHSRKTLREHGLIEFTEYPLDFDLLARLENEQGFVIGYHCNAYEQSLYDLAGAQHRMMRDIEFLQERFRIRYWSAHGGVPAPGGENNNQIIPPSEVTKKLRWVHNGASPYFNATYSDGGLNNRKRDPNGRDLRDFVKSWKPGGRYRVLTHPQYYSSPPEYNTWLASAAWYREMLDRYRRKGDDGWNEMLTATCR